MRSNYKQLGKYIRPVDERNTELGAQTLLGVSIEKVFMPSIANIIGTDMSTYKKVKRGQFAYGPVTSRNGDKISIALQDQYDEAIVSQAYTPFEVIDPKELLPEYLMMWFRRPEFDRYARFMSHGSAREIFEWDEMCKVTLPVPPPDKQKEIVKEYNAVVNRIHLNNQLIQKLEETAQAIYKQWFVDFEFPDENGQPYKSSGGQMVENELGIIPKSWQVDSLKNTSELINAGVIPKYSKEGFDYVLGQKCVHDSYVDLKFARLHEPKENCPLVKFGDILINSTGAGTLGRVGQIYFKPKKISFDSNMTLVRAKNDLFVDYLGCFLSNKESYFIQVSQGSTNQTRLYCSMINPVQILIPAKIVIQQFKGRVRPIRIHQQALRDENVILKQLNDLLLSKLATIEN